MQPKVTLVFPSSMTAAHAYSRNAEGRGERIIAASSVKADETARLYAQWVYLPSIYDEGFADALRAAVTLHHITHFFTPHAMVYAHVADVIATHGLALSMASEPPIATLNRYYRDVFTHADNAQSFVAAIAGTNAERVLLTSLFHYAEQIYGQTSETKIAAIASAFMSAPKGDVVEIGSAWGRSAFVLAMLAQHHHTGSVLCIDPWNEDIARQKESSDALDALNHALDWDHMFRIFTVNLAPFAATGRFNYLRTTSEDAAAKYRTNAHVASPEFGTTSYTQRTALIHIDGNHDYDAIHADVALWRPTLLPGGWLIIDDYVWEHGTGPRIVGDALLAREQSNILTAFTAGKALFIQFREAV